ncbi:retrovirus-related pol polyprotein from transposon TNT 1-94 [Tanacetum coccineum]
MDYFISVHPRSNVNSFQDTMAHMNIPANDAPAEQAPAIAPPTKTDDQILPCQLDEQWFKLYKDILRDALDIPPANDDNPFVASPSSDTVIEYVNTLGYPNTLRNMSAMSVNALYQPWRAILIWEEFVQSIQTFLTDRNNLTTTSRRKKKTAHLLIPNVRFTKLIIHHLKTKHDIHPRTGSTLHYSHEENVLNTLRYVRKDSREIFGMPIPDTLLTDTIKRAPYYNGYLEHVAEYQRYLDEEHDKADDKKPKTTLSQPSKPTPTPTEPSQKDQGKKRKLVKKTSDVQSPTKRSKVGKVTKKRVTKSPLKLIDEPSDEGVLVEEPAYNKEEANLQRAVELSLKEQGERTHGPAHPVVLREPDSERIQRLPDVQGKGKDKVVDKQAAHDLLTLQTPKKKSSADQFIFQRRTPMPTKASGHAESPSLDAELALTDSETEFDNEVPKINTGDQEEGQAGPNPGNQDEGQAGPNPCDQDEDQAGSNPGDAVESQPQSSHVVPAGLNLEHMDLEATDASTQQKPNSSRTLSSLQNLEKDLSFADQFFMEKPQEEEPGKTNAEAEVQSMVSVLIHQDTTSVPPMTTPVINLTKSQSDSLLPTATISAIMTTTTTLPPPPPQPQQSTTNPILVKRIGELEQHMADRIQKNLALEERLDKQGIRLYNLENLNIPHKVSQAVDEIVTDVVDWAMQAPLRARFRDLPTPPLPPPPAGASGAPGTSGASGSSQLPPPPPPPSTGTSGSAQQQGSNALSSSKTAALASQSMAWTTSDTRYESAGVSGAQELSPTDSLMHEDSIPDEQVHLSDDEDSGNDHLPKADSRKDWWKPLPEEERPATPEPAWIIPSSNVSDVENNWASALVSTSETPAENSLLAKTGDMTTFMKWYCRQMNKTELTQADFEGQAYEVVDWTNPEGDQVRFDVKRPLPLGGLPGHETIQTHFFFNKDLEYLRYGNKGSSPALSISKMKAARYLDFSLELLVPEQMWIEDV